MVCLLVRLRLRSSSSEGSIAGANDAGIGCQRWRIVGNGAGDGFADVGEFVECFVQFSDARRCLAGFGGEKATQHGNLLERLSKREQVAGGCGAHGDAAGEAFEIENAAERAEEFVALDGAGPELLYGVEAGFNFSESDFRAENPAAQ